MSTVISKARAMIPVARPFLGVEEEQGVLEVLRSGWVTQGPRVAEFERKFARFVGCEHAIAVSSCTTALQLSLWASGIGPGDEVICPSLSFIATANAIKCLGATPVFADIDASTYNIDPEVIEGLISPRTKAILAVHQMGLPAELNALQEIAIANKLKLIEDAACAIGASFHGEMIGKPVGDIACFSFHPRKIMTTGEGGMITTQNPELAARMSRLRQHAMSLSDVARHNSRQVALETYDEVGFNFRMTDMQAAVGIAQLDRLSTVLVRRRLLAKRYTTALNHLSWLQTPRVPTYSDHNYQSYMVLLTVGTVADRDAMMQRLLEKGISTRRAIMAIHREKPYQSSVWEERLPRTNRISDAGIILPLFHEMSELDQDYVIDTVLEMQP